MKIFSFSKTYASPLLSLTLSLAIWGIGCDLVRAETIPPPIEPPLDLTLLQPGADPAARGILTATTISQEGLTIPSLWWVREQFGGKLLDNWLAYPENADRPNRVDLIVNRQIWSLLDYLERYRFVNQFGITAKDYGYNTRVFNRQGTLLAAYTCEVGPEPGFCQIWLDSSGFQGQRENPFLQQ